MMRSDGVSAASGGGSGGGGGGSVNNGLATTSFKALSSCLKIASAVASTVRSAASSVVEREWESESSSDQVLWAGFDKLECEGGVCRQVLLLGYQYGFEVWDVEETDNVHYLVSTHDGPVSFMQILPNPIVPKQSTDKFSDSRPLLIMCADSSFSGGSDLYVGSVNSCNGSVQHSHETPNGCFTPTLIWFYSLKYLKYVHLLKFRSVVHLVRCSSRVVAVLQAAQIHCFDAATLEREYTIPTNPVVTGCPASRGLGVGPLAVGPRWIAYSGSPVTVSNPARVNPQPPTQSSFPSHVSNVSVVAHYAKESSKQLAAGIVTLGDMGYKKLSRYCSELLPDGTNSQSGNARIRLQGIDNGHSVDADNFGMVIVMDTVSWTVIAQFRAHKSPISSLCFDPSGTLLVTASVQGHNINVFHIMPQLSSNSSGADPESSYAHLYKLQRGFTNAVIQDISFSNDSHWVLVSSSRGTSHLFAISPSGGSVSFPFEKKTFSGKSGGSSMMEIFPPRGQVNLDLFGPPITLSVVCRIRSGGNSWINTVSGAAAVATGKINSVSGAIASAFHYCKGNDIHADASFLKTNYHLMVFSPSGCLTQYAMRLHSGLNSVATMSGFDAAYESTFDAEDRSFLEAIQKWNICQKRNVKEREGNIDISGENGGYSATVSTITKDKLTSEGRNSLYISEAELQTHQARSPLWAKPEIMFQLIESDDINIVGERGEIEIEKIPARVIEVRSKYLVPVADNLQDPRAAELGNGTGETSFDGLQMPTEKFTGFIDNKENPQANTWFETVNNRESSMMECQSKRGTCNRGVLRMENRIDCSGDQFD